MTTENLALDAAPARGHMLQTFSMWAMACHLTLAIALLSGWSSFAACLLPASHMMAWSVFVGAHALVGFYPETMHRPRIAGHAALEGKCLAILVGHELLHVAPVVALYLVPGLWPGHAALGAFQWGVGTAFALALGLVYFFWQFREDNAYGASKAHLGAMFALALAAGLAANALAVLKLGV
jgi:hypothetical protein